MAVSLINLPSGSLAKELRRMGVQEVDCGRIFIKTG
jgi:hypothetical protein